MTPVSKYNKQTSAAITLQSFWRSYTTQKKYGIKQLTKDETQDYQAFLVGNEPRIVGLDKHRVHDEKIALIGTSCLRSLWLACQLGNSKYTPKLIIVDNSQQVTTFWRKLRDFVTENSFTDSQQFYNKFAGFLGRNKTLYRDIPDDYMTKSHDTTEIKYEGQDPIKFIEKMIQAHGMKTVMSIIAHSSVISGSWHDPLLFGKLKNTLRYNGINNIFAYPSNIAHCIKSKDEAMKVFESIVTIAPKASIISDVSSTEDTPIPKHVFITDKHSPQRLKELVTQHYPFRHEHRAQNPSMIRMMLLSLLMAQNPQMDSEILNTVLDVDTILNNISRSTHGDNLPSSDDDAPDIIDLYPSSDEEDSSSLFLNMN